ncbi:MAG: hypothetical protein EBZ49_05515 [Proteobacteria bacterium]|nr:hypothetical protein [Pseudomonadota bacterium]NDC23573.1 hypothetical protein [Pseudomonadota bacterium]
MKMSSFPKNIFCLLSLTGFRKSGKIMKKNLKELDVLQNLMLLGLIFVTPVFSESPVPVSVDYSGTPLELSDSGKGLSDTGRKVQVFPTAVVTQGKNKWALKLSGAGVRWKTVAVIDVNVYAAANYLDTQLKMDPAQPLKSIAASKAKVMQLTFFRSLTAKEIGEALKSALEKNGVNVKAPHLNQFFGQFEFSVSPGETLTLIGLNTGKDEEEVIALAPSQMIHGKGKGMATDIWKGYFGVPNDSGLEDLKKKLLSAP